MLIRLRGTERRWLEAIRSLRGPDGWSIATKDDLVGAYALLHGGDAAGRISGSITDFCEATGVLEVWNLPGDLKAYRVYLPDGDIPEWVDVLTPKEGMAWDQNKPTKSLMASEVPSPCWPTRSRATPVR